MPDPSKVRDAFGVPDDHGGFAQFVVDGVSDDRWKAIGPLPRQHGILAAMIGEAARQRLADVRRDPRFADHVREQGREVHAFTVNHPDDVRFLRELGVSAFTTDCLPEVHAALDEPLQPLAVA